MPTRRKRLRHKAGTRASAYLFRFLLPSVGLPTLAATKNNFSQTPSWREKPSDANMKNQIGLFTAPNIVSNTIGEARITYRRTGQPWQKVKSSKDSYEFLLKIWDRDEIQYRESFCVLCMSRDNRITSYHFISHGGSSGVVVDPKMVFQTALLSHASAMILAHNHPSEQLSPSHADMRLTERLVKAGQLLDLPVVDHIIVTEAGYYSFADEGRI